MTELRFTQSHEWISVEDGIATVGITRYAADPEGKAWFFRVRLANPSSVAALMTKDQYTEFLKGL